MSELPIRRRGWTGAACHLALCVLVIAAMGSATAADEVSEASLKATYLYKILAYVDWPEGSFATPEAPQVIALRQADAVGAELERLAAERALLPGERRVVVRRVAADESLDGVHVLHLGRGARPADPAALRRLPLLVITDSPDGMPDYAALNFVTVHRRVRFEAAPAVAERAGLKLSARLLAVAERVIAP